MSKSNPSEVKLAVPTSGGFSGLKSLNLQVFVMIAAIIAIMLFFTWTTDGAYLSARNVSNLLRQTAITGILAVGMVFVIISAEIDLSVGSMMGLLGGVAAICDVWLGWPLPLTIIVTLVLGLLLGGSRTAKSLHLLSPSRACWHFAAYSLASPTARLYPPPAPRCHKLGKAISPPVPASSLARLA